VADEAAVKTLAQVLNEIRPEVDFAASQDFLADGLLDSFDMVALVATLDAAHAIAIEGVDIVPVHFKNLDTIAALLRKYGVGR
jgi:acyl carrier protein